MESYGIGAVAMLGLVFYLVRRVPSFLFCGAAILGGFMVITSPQAVDRLAEWRVMTAGLFAAFAGLVIVRLILIRSVSLQLLGRIDGVRDVAFHDEISGRLNDMRVCRLVRRTDGRNTLTPLGHVIAAVVATFYSMLRIDG